jgi:hypothetical protein
LKDSFHLTFGRRKLASTSFTKKLY